MDTTRESACVALAILLLCHATCTWPVLLLLCVVSYLAVHFALFCDDLLHNALRFLQLGSRQRLAVTKVEPSRTHYEYEQNMTSATATADKQEQADNKTRGDPPPPKKNEQCRKLHPCLGENPLFRTQ